MEWWHGMVSWPMLVLPGLLLGAGWCQWRFEGAKGGWGLPGYHHGDMAAWGGDAASC